MDTIQEQRPTQAQATPEKQSEIKPPSKEQQPQTIEEIFVRIANDFQDVPPLHSLAKKLNVHPGQLVLVIIMVAFALTVVGEGNILVRILIGILYPAYMSAQAIKHKQEDKAKLWLSYWMLILSSSLIDRLVWFFLHDLQPLYYPVKNMFTIWLYYPRTRGALIVQDYLTSKFIMMGILDKAKKE
ncbi:hypothetical protein pb186bvf_020289 [Paramecium bursaria]